MKATEILRLLKFSYLCGLSYSGKGWENFGYKLKLEYNKDSIQYYIIENEEECIIVFRGTDELKDVFTDINVNFYSSIYGRIHYGFFKAWENINFYLRNNLPIGKKIYITGHSLGGALAQIAGLFIYNEAIITFGSPMIHHFKDMHLINTNHIRVRNCNDVITKLPYLNYEHTGKLVYLDYNGKIKDKVSLFDNLKGHLKAWSKKQWFDGVYDHKLTEYQDKLANLENYEH